MSSSGAAKRVSALALVACVSGLVGYSLGEMRHLGSIPLAEAVANIWESQIGLLTDAQGHPRDSDGMATSAQFSLATLTTALAVHHDQITADQWARIEPRLASTLAVTPPEVRDRMAAIVQCIQEGRRAGRIAQPCVQQALAVPFRSVAATPRELR